MQDLFVPNRIAVILVAAGRGLRAQRACAPTPRTQDRAKQWQPLLGIPAALHAVCAFREAGLNRLLLVIRPEDAPFAEKLALPWVQGGASRTQSVRAGLEALARAPNPPELVLVHDAARPCVSPDLIRRVVDALAEADAVVPVIPVVDALWRGDGRLLFEPVAREGLWRAQTPQGFRLAAILNAHRAAAEKGLEGKDDAELACTAGLAVVSVPGEEENLKLTYPEDFARAEALLSWRARPMPSNEKAMIDIRVGHGFDVHPFGPGNRLWLLGVEIPHERALVGHSDADAGLHALTDAILGALALGDIGRHFPPTDPRWRGAASRIFLVHAVGLAKERGFRLMNADVTVICERPKIAPHVPQMREVLAELLEIDADRVSIKATTSERLGFTGREEGIAALATVTLASF